MFFPYPKWESDPERCVYLGSERDPRTKRPYDYWAIKTNEMEAPLNWSYTYRFGSGDGDYGSGPLCIAWYDFTGTAQKCFASARAQQLTLYYLATGLKPLADALSGVS